MKTPRGTAIRIFLGLLALGLAARSAVSTNVPFSAKAPGMPSQCYNDSAPRRSAAEADWESVGQNSHIAGSAMTKGVLSCLSCHDGTVAPADKSYARSTGYAGPEHYEGSGSHPVGVDYGQAMRSRPDEYNDPRANPGIRLSDNKVTCLSCHDPETPRNFKMPGEQTNLCLTCHRL